MTDQTETDNHPERERSASACSGGFYGPEYDGADEGSSLDCCLDLSATRDPADDTFYCDGCGSKVPVPGSAYDGTGPHRYRVEVRSDTTGKTMAMGHTDYADGGRLRQMAEAWPGYTYRGAFDTAPARP